LEDLLISPASKEELGGGPKKDYRRGEHQTPPSSFNVAPTYLQSRQALGIEDFQLKSSCQIAISKSNPHIFGSLKKPDYSRYSNFCNIVIPSLQKRQLRLVPLDYCFYILLLFIPK
jgi:hypothetical protein